jgi:hypothetical protein
MNNTDKENELDILSKIEWALETKRQKLTFGLDEKDAVYARERRLFGVLLDCKKEITSLKAELEKARELITDLSKILNLFDGFYADELKDQVNEFLKIKDGE